RGRPSIPICLVDWALRPQRAITHVAANAHFNLLAMHAPSDAVGVAPVLVRTPSTIRPRTLSTFFEDGCYSSSAPPSSSVVIVVEVSEQRLNRAAKFMRCFCKFNCAPSEPINLLHQVIRSDVAA